MKPQDLDRLEQMAEDQAVETRASTSRAASILEKFKMTNDQKRRLLDQYAAEDAAVAKKKKAPRGI